MFMKTIVLLAPLALGGFYLTNGFGGEWSREVGRPVGQVIAGLEDLDVRDQPGAPGSDPARSGGVRPLFRVEKTDRLIRWFVMSGDKVATVMTAELEPLDDGARTRVTAHVERGDAPDDFVSPAFRSTGITLGLFISALEGELNELVQPATGDARKCLDLRNGAMGGVDSPRPGPRPRPRDLRTAIGQTSENVTRLHAFDAEWRRISCAAFDDKNLEDLTYEPSDAADDEPVGSTRSRRPEVNFTPGEPMIDPTPASED